MSGPQGANGTPGQVLLDEARKGQVGSVLDMVGVANINQLQQAALQSRLRIPLVFALDVIYGYKTMFPISLGESSAWDPTLASADSSVAAAEATADGIKWTFSPMVDVTRDPRWGRVQRTSGGAGTAGLRLRRGPAQAAQLALTAGIDIEMAVTIPSQYSTYDNTGPQLLAAHRISMGTELHRSPVWGMSPSSTADDTGNYGGFGVEGLALGPGEGLAQCRRAPPRRRSPRAPPRSRSR